MRLLENIKKARDDRRFTKVYNAAVAEGAARLAPQIVEESLAGSDAPVPVIIGKSLFEGDRPKGRALAKYITERRRMPARQISSTTIVRSTYDYARIDQFYEKESYFSRSLIRQIETMMRNGYEFTSEDSDMLALTKQEFTRIQMESGIPLNQFLFSMAMHLLKYGIAIVHKVRDRVKDPVAPDDKRKERIIKLRLVRPHTANFYVNDKGMIMSVWDGNPSWLSQAIQSVKRGIYTRGTTLNTGIPASDLMIAYMSDPADEIFPDPPCFELLDDILTLRSIEETVELLCFQYGSPLLHAKIGNDEYLPTPTEIAEVNTQLGSVAPNGMITTDHRVDIEVINIQKGITNLIPFLEHFKNRVLVGSGSSPISVGEGDTANRSSAESIDDALADHCTFLSNAMSDPINLNLIPDILVRSDTEWTEESLFDASGDLNVKLEFNETRLEKEIARSNNIINLWQGNLLKFSEARRMLKKGPITESDMNDMYVNMVQIPLKEAGTQASMMDGTMSVSNKAKSQNQPTNQHGTKAGPGSRKDVVEKEK